MLLKHVCVILYIEYHYQGGIFKWMNTYITQQHDSRHNVFHIISLGANEPDRKKTATSFKCRHNNILYKIKYDSFFFSNLDIDVFQSNVLIVFVQVLMQN